MNERRLAYMTGASGSTLKTSQFPHPPSSPPKPLPHALTSAHASPTRPHLRPRLSHSPSPPPTPLPLALISAHASPTRPHLRPRHSHSPSPPPTPLPLALTSAHASPTRPHLRPRLSHSPSPPPTPLPLALISAHASPTRPHLRPRHSHSPSPPPTPLLQRPVWIDLISRVLRHRQPPRPSGATRRSEAQKNEIQLTIARNRTQGSCGSVDEAAPHQNRHSVFGKLDAFGPSVLVKKNMPQQDNAFGKFFLASPEDFCKT
ncbi:uncharacterized protein LOC134767614 [Penaeus indicus]|uniref:uncharacterized protein LOC134767614 n=1 Tax=Penaeus indicus TaxID=29960 RepID=UPI00300D4AC7